jgi:hypothetical protein
VQKTPRPNKASFSLEACDLSWLCPHDVSYAQWIVFFGNVRHRGRWWCVCIGLGEDVGWQHAPRKHGFVWAVHVKTMCLAIVSLTIGAYQQLFPIVVIR